MIKAEGFRVVAADVIKQDLLVHFSDQTSVLFQAEFLSASRHQGEAVALTEETDLIEASGSSPDSNLLLTSASKKTFRDR